ncbi:hypothetical protein PTKIN_Ptkin08bG0008500 [Pterospermum kingtungense]
MDLDNQESALGFSQLNSKLRRSVNKSKDSRASKMESSPSGSGSTLKRSSMAIQNQKVSCLVDGCESDLGKHREYYRRHRVCEHHSKDPIVVVSGEEQRFCQQCSRFHDLGEFDDEKRSCRKRLDGHNRRRRKFRPKSFYMSPESVLGSKILQFSHPNMHATPAMARINPGEHERIGQVAPVVSVCRRLANALASSEGGRGSHNIQGNGISRSMDNSCARSLPSPVISFQSIAPVSIIEPFSSTLTPDADRDQINAAGSSNMILQAWPDGLLDDEARITFKCS